MNEHRASRKLSTEDLNVAIDTAGLGFSTTDELEPLDDIVAQPRALRALELGLGIRHPSYNIYVAGMTGMAKNRMLQRALAERVGREPTPPDWVYVNNFDEPGRPIAISLSPGEGSHLRRHVREAVERLREELPKAFEQEDLGRQKHRLGHEFQEEMQRLSRDLEKLAEHQGLALQQLPGGEVVLVPIKDGRAMSPEDVQRLTPEQREDLRRREREVGEQATAFLSRQQERQRDIRARIKRLEREFAARHVKPILDEVRQRHSGSPVHHWLDKAEAHIVDNLGPFLGGDGRQHQVARMLGLPEAEADPSFNEYDVNVLVDNEGVRGPPVVIEDSPNYRNLFGIIDRQIDPRGRAQTDFTQIRAGSLLRAAGGFLIFSLLDALVEPVVWKELKRSIKRGSLQIEDYEPLGLFSISALKPDPIPLDVRLVAVGDPHLYHLLHVFDEDFRDIFKVKAEFTTDMKRDQGSTVLLGRLLRRLARDAEGILPFRAEGVAELLHTAMRLAGDNRKLTAEFSQLADVAREASFWASREDLPTVDARHVRRAAEERVYRSDLVAEKIRELIEDGTLRVELDGVRVAQVTGLALVDLGDHAFGRPIRVTAAVGMGRAGVINVERESKLSGKAHDKGLLILEGFLRGKYARRRPLALSASLAMEQSYGVVEGDSASAGELLGLLSALAGVPLRQDIAVTGSVDQWGNIQAVGAVTEKVEGYFDVCCQCGLTGRQGVLLPAANARNLILRPEVLRAVREQRFHLWTMDHIDAGLHLLSGLPAGDIDQRESVHGRAYRQVMEMAEAESDSRANGRAERRDLAEKPSDREPRPSLEWPGDH